MVDARNSVVLRARDQARVFLLAARRCNEFRPLPSGVPQYLEVPSLVLYAFAIEVGIKALALHFEGTAERGHDLAPLFRSLPADLQARIVRDACVDVSGKPVQGAVTHFDEDLDLVSDVFDVWRYIYETHPVDTNLGFLQRFARAVEGALNGIP